MRQTKSAEQEKAEFVRAAEAMYEELHAWREKHLDASFDEIADQVTPRRRVLMGVLLEKLAVKADERIEAPMCEQCGEAMSYRGTPRRGGRAGASLLLLRPLRRGSFSPSTIG